MDIPTEPQQIKEFIKKLNSEIANPRDSFDTINGFETILESLIYKIYDVFGRNSLLSMTYQIGAGPGTEIAEKILEEKKVDKIEDPFEAFRLLLDKNRDFYSITVTDIKVDDSDPKFTKVTVFFKDRCFYRETLKNRKRLRIGGPLCRINKGYFETAFKKLTGIKTEINFIKNEEEDDACFEKLTFFIPKE